MMSAEIFHRVNWQIKHTLPLNLRHDVCYRWGISSSRMERSKQKSDNENFSTSDKKKVIEGGQLARAPGWTGPSLRLRGTTLTLLHTPLHITTALQLNMAVDRRMVGVFGVAFVLRLLLICLFPALPDLLTGRVEVSTPVNSFKRCE